jgi:hypothetical protein
MALFSFSDITFSNKQNGQSSANRLTENSAYQTNILRYPIDLGESDKGHYMVIHVNEQLKTNFKGISSTDQPTVIENRATGRSLNPVQPIADIIRDATRLISGNSGGLVGKKIENELTTFNTNFTRTIKRTTDTIALYMPDTVAFTHNQAYSDLQLSGGLTAAAASVSSLAEKLKSGNKTEFVDLLSSFAPFLADRLRGSDVFRAGFTAFTGVVVNPLLDLIYTSPEFRTFRFDFMFYPRSQKEAQEVQEIINRLYFHQAPEIDTESFGFFLVPPSEFDIKFYYNGQINKNIPDISTCVLTSIDVDYAPSGFSAYEVPGNTTPSVGGTGMPVAIRMSLQFKETEVLTKAYYKRNSDEYQKKLDYTNASQSGQYGTS